MDTVNGVTVLKEYDRHGVHYADVRLPNGAEQTIAQTSDGKWHLRRRDGSLSNGAPTVLFGCLFAV